MPLEDIDSRVRHAYFLREYCAKIIRGTVQHERHGWECAALLLRAGLSGKQGARKKGARSTMVNRNVWMKSKGVTIDNGKMVFCIQGKNNERVGELTITQASITWRAPYQRKNKSKTMPWEKFSERMLQRD